MTLTKADIAKNIHERMGFRLKESLSLCEEVLDIIKSTLKSGEEVKIHRFGKFEIRQKMGHKGRNPHTGETVSITSRKIVTFKLSGQLRERINGMSN